MGGMGSVVLFWATVGVLGGADSDLAEGVLCAGEPLLDSAERSSLFLPHPDIIKRVTVIPVASHGFRCLMGVFLSLPIVSYAR
jgi:hypothetical protein